MSSFASLSGSSVAIDSAALKAFRASLSGETIAPGDAAYDEARAVWNAMIDKRPALIARCANTDDIVKCVKFAAQHSILSSVRGAGHNVAGSALADGGLVIDLSGLKEVTVDHAKKTAQIQPGATLADVDKATQAHGLIVPTGINSTTGIAGLVLGGGVGWNSRKYGLTCDALKSVDIVTADGAVRHADANENSDLYWAVRGGGGNFGVIANFEFNLYPVGPEVYAGLIVFSLAEGKTVLAKFRELSTSVSRET
ncbi:MAG TPA: FAD-binding oxidoreductase, partial [candidate division Zixibacteria bacterium]|nr:FAD-binding oxidoreductase [candidate division Zixibacteria bacterium]